MNAASAAKPPLLAPGALPEARHFDPVLRPDLAGLYAARAARLNALAPGHDLQAFLALAAAIAAAQGAALAQAPVAGPAAGPVQPAALAAAGDWIAGLDRILALLQAQYGAESDVGAHLARLQALDRPARIKAATALAEARFSDVDPALAPLIWAGLSLAVAQAARQADLPPKSDTEPSHCPICASHPVASHIHSGDRQGLRYLHCALCDCEWHVVRAKCSCCGRSGGLDYLSFDTPEAAVRAEACADCESYLKIISAERDPAVETVADDLATLVLDDAAQAEGFGRTGLNPFALPG